MRPDVVWFGEPLPARALADAERASRGADLFLLVGTSAVVYPAASLPLLARASGARVIEVNVEETALTSEADLSIRGAAGELLPRLVEEAFPAAREEG
jgi:NAD-dependent deacetylase